MKLIVGLGNPGAEVPRHAAQHRLRGRWTNWRGGRSVEFEAAPVDALIGDGGGAIATRCWPSR